MLRFRAMGRTPEAAGDARAPRLPIGRMAGRAPAGVLTSRDNKWLKQFRMALRGGIPTESGFVGVEGVRLVEEALRSGCRIAAVLFSESGERYRERLAPFIGRPEIAFPVLLTTDRLFEGLADTEHPQGVAALVEPRTTTFDDLLRAPDGVCSPLLVVLAGVQDPGNVGQFCGPPRRLERRGRRLRLRDRVGRRVHFRPKRCGLRRERRCIWRCCLELRWRF